MGLPMASQETPPGTHSHIKSGQTLVGTANMSMEIQVRALSWKNWATMSNLEALIREKLI